MSATPSPPPVPRPPRVPVRVATGRAIGYAALVGGILAAIALAVATLLGADPAWYGMLLVCVLAGIVAHVLLLRGWPPVSRWSCVGRAILAAYAGAGGGMLVLAPTSPGIAVIAIVVFTLVGGFAVTGAIAYVCAPLLDRRFGRSGGVRPRPAR